MRALAACLLASITHLTSCCVVTEAAAAEWKTGEPLQQRLSLPASIRWSANPLREGLDRLARTHEVAIFLDRRVDPDQELTCGVPARPLWDLIREIASQAGAGAGRVGSIVYLGPPASARVLGTTIELRRAETSAMPAAVRATLERRRPLSWPELTTPRQLIERLAGEVGMEIEGVEQLPHDLWRQSDLPPIDFCEGMGLLLAGFGQSFEFLAGARRIRLVPLPETAAIERSYRLPPSSSLLLAELGSRVPGAQFTSRSDQLLVAGTVEEHDEVRRLLSPRAKSPREAEVRYTLRIENQLVEDVAKGLATRLGLQVQFGEGVESRIRQRATFQVEDATRDELIDALLSPAGLAYRIDGGTLHVLPAD